MRRRSYLDTCRHHSLTYLRFNLFLKETLSDAFSLSTLKQLNGVTFQVYNMFCTFEVEEIRSIFSIIFGKFCNYLQAQACNVCANFFRRNVLKKRGRALWISGGLLEIRQCFQWNRISLKCEMFSVDERRCQTCRLKLCVAMGMSAECELDYQNEYFVSPFSLITLTWERDRLWMNKRILHFDYLLLSIKHKMYTLDSCSSQRRVSHNREGAENRRERRNLKREADSQIFRELFRK